jgi:hypothetical protein
MTLRERFRVWWSVWRWCACRAHRLQFDLDRVEAGVLHTPERCGVAA